jgi:ferredoxin
MYKRLLVLHFPPDITDKPIVCILSRDFNLCFNILKAEILSGREGYMVLELSGEKRDVQDGLRFLKAHGIKVKPVEREIRKNNEKCVHCGACTGICPTQALYMDRNTWEVNFDVTKCTACEFCVPVCPVRAMEIKFSRDNILQ